jgi:hypothetical protein
MTQHGCTRHVTGSQVEVEGRQVEGLQQELAVTQARVSTKATHAAQ